MLITNYVITMHIIYNIQNQLAIDSNDYLIKKKKSLTFHY